MKYLMTALVLQVVYARDQHSHSEGVASRVLRQDSNGSQQSCQNMEGNAEKILNEFYQPASFDCECVESNGSLKAATTYNISCKTHSSMRRNDIFGYIHWSGEFSRFGPTQEKACISYNSDECKVLDDKEICYSFNYHRSKPWRGTRTEKSPPLMTCDVTVDGQVCSQCNVCDGSHTDQGIQYTAANCTNVSGMDSLNSKYEGVKTEKDIRDLVFKCPTPEEIIPKTVRTVNQSVRSGKSGKSSKIGSKRGKGSEGSKKV